MTTVDLAALKDSLNRMAKIDLDTGHAPTVEAALARMRGHTLQIAVGPEASTSAAHQAALLTLVNITRRFALGGVMVSGCPTAPSLTTSIYGDTLTEAVITLGGRVERLDRDLPTIIIGSADTDAERCCTVTFEGWRGGVVGRGRTRLNETTTVITAAVLAAAFGAAEGFAMLRGEVEAGRRSVGLSLWRPSMDWKDVASDGPMLAALPDHLWVLGLGHLGQAFLWNLLVLPYARPARVRLTLQDTDVITTSTDSTSILAQVGMVGEFKTRAMARVLEARGFTTTLIERPFDGRFQSDPSIDPAALICGVDNALARSRLETAGFPLIVEAGLGNSAQDFRAMRLHTFPSEGKRAADVWMRSPPASAKVDVPAYQALASDARDPCGLARLAGTAVGAPFVGAIASSLMLGQLLRQLAGDPIDAVVDLDLCSIEGRRVVTSAVQAFAALSWQRTTRIDAGRPDENALGLWSDRS
jgi:hypothetical protein